MDMFLYAAQNPNCILAVNADRGGSWWSTLQPPQLRDFSKGYQWNALQDALRALSWTSDYHFTFDFTVADDLENGSYWIMYQSNGRISFALEKDARGYRFVFGSYSFIGGVFVYTPFAPSAAGRHSATLAIIGNTFRITLAGAVYEQTGERAASSGYDRVVTTAAPVTLHAVSLTDDSTGTAVWQTAYSDLYDTSNPWPSPVPRNFAEEPEAWRDEETTAPSIGEGDCEFFIRYRLDGYPEGSEINQIFYHNSQNGSINIAFAGDGTGGNYSVIRLTDTDGVVIPLDRVRQLGEHTIRIQRVGLFVTVEFDGEVVATSSAGTKKIAVYSTTAPVSDFDGVVFKTYWKSLTTGRTVWRYPSDAERVRLITKTNVRTDRGAFEAADPARMAGVKTQLDLRGNTTCKTFLVRGYFPKHGEAGNLYIHPLIGQGDISSGGNNWIFQLSVWEDYRTGALPNLRFGFVPASKPELLLAVYRLQDAFFNKTHDIAGTIEFDASDTVTICIYIDGVQVMREQKNYDRSGFGQGAGSPLSGAVGIRQDPDASYLSGNTVDFSLVFDRALTAEQIAAIQ